MLGSATFVMLKKSHRDFRGMRRVAFKATNEEPAGMQRGMMDSSNAHEIKFFGNCPLNLPRELAAPPSLAICRVICDYFI